MIHNIHNYLHSFDHLLMIASRMHWLLEYCATYFFVLKTGFYEIVITFLSPTLKSKPIKLKTCFWS